MICMKPLALTLILVQKILCIDDGGLGSMARLVELGLTLKGEEAEEFLKNEKSPAFTSEQLAFFRQAKRIYKANCTKF
jgi:hypothetical protein